MNASRFQLHFLDIGQGDATLITTPTNCKILIDGGKPGTVSDKLIDNLNFNSFKEFDLVVATHPDLDHYGGLIKLSQTSSIKNLVLSSSSKKDKFYSYFLSLNSDVPTIYPTNLKQFYLCGLDIWFFSFPSEDSNASSVVTIVKFPDQTKVFLGGDIESHEEKEIIKTYPDLKIDILKANHHGSKTSNSYSFLESLDPEYFIISSKKGNSYGHPSSSTIINTKKLNLKVMRTDLEGTVSFFF